MTINVSQTHASADTVTSCYNGRNTPTPATSSASTDYSYTYGVDANMSSRTQRTTTTNYTYNAANQLTAAGSTTYAHDANGNMTGNSAGLSLSYNAGNQTTSIDPAGAVGAVSMAYAGTTQDERTAKGSTTF